MSVKRLIVVASGILVLLSLGAALEVRADTPTASFDTQSIKPLRYLSSQPPPRGMSTNTLTPTSTPQPCDAASDYVVIATTGASIVPGTNDIGNHCIDCVTNLALPFPVHLYDSTFTSVNVSSHGNLQFGGSSSIAYNNVCLPYPGFDFSIMPHWDDIRTDISSHGTGIFVSVSGVMPNRIFNIEWRTNYVNYLADNRANFEVRLYESGNRFDIIYGTVDQSGAGATIGVQKGNGIQYTQYSCNLDSLQSGLELTFRQYACNEITFTPTFTRTSTSTPTATYTPTPTPTGPTFTRTITPTPTSTGNAGPVDMYGGSTWLPPGTCPNPTLQLFTSFWSLAYSEAPPRPPATPICNIGSTHMLLQNSRGERIDFYVPPLNCYNLPYRFDCSVGPCLPYSWLDALPFTLTVNYLNEVNERYYGNNSSVQSDPLHPARPVPRSRPRSPQPHYPYWSGT